MSHQIQDNMIAWKNETPWHGLGYEVPANATGEEMLKIAKLDWNVQRRRIAMRPGDGNKQIMLTAPLENFRAIVRSDNDEVFQVSTDRYQPVQNREIVEFFREYCEAGHATMETVGGLKGGAIVWALAKLNGGSDANIGGVDALRGYMLLATAHNGSLRTIGKPTNVRVVCWNTLSAAVGLSGGRLGTKEIREFRMKHTRKWSPEVAAEAKEIMGMAIEQLQASNALAGALAKVKIDGKGKIKFLRTLLNLDKKEQPVVVEPTEDEIERVLNATAEASGLSAGDVKESEVEELGRAGREILEAVYTSPGSKLATADGTLWGLVNGVTFYADHVRGRSQDTRLANAWFGAGDNLKTDAVKLAVQTAGIN